MNDPVTVRPMRDADVAEADRIFRLAFGTFLGLPDPMQFGGDADCIRSRWLTDPDGALVAKRGGAVVGSNLVTCWGTVGFFGPLTVRPDLWDKGVARALLTATNALLDRRAVRVRGLYTFAQSAKHVRLYQRFGYWPRFLNATLSTAVAKKGTFELARAEDEAALRDLAGAVHPGFDPVREARALRERSLGGTVLVREGGVLVAAALCHVGAGSEAGSGVAHVKLGLVRPGPRAAASFERLLDASEAFAASRGVERLRGGVHTSRLDAYRVLVARGWRTDMQGVSMIDPADGAGYDRPELFVIEDWR